MTVHVCLHEPGGVSVPLLEWLRNARRPPGTKGQPLFEPGGVSMLLLECLRNAVQPPGSWTASLCAGQEGRTELKKTSGHPSPAAASSAKDGTARCYRFSPLSALCSLSLSCSPALLLSCSILFYPAPSCSPLSALCRSPLSALCPLPQKEQRDVIENGGSPPVPLCSIASSLLCCSPLSNLRSLLSLSPLRAALSSLSNTSQKPRPLQRNYRPINPTITATNSCGSGWL